MHYSLIVLWYFPEGGKYVSQRRRNNGLINHRLLELQIRISNQLSKHVPTSLCDAELLSFRQLCNVILMILYRTYTLKSFSLFFFDSASKKM